MMIKIQFPLILAALFFVGMSAFVSVTEEPVGLSKGEKAPDFVAKDNKGREIKLSQMLQKGPVIVFFYRGHWCPYCSKQLSAMQDSLEYLTKKGASVVAITPEADMGMEKTVKKTKASFPIVHDLNGQIMKAYKVAFDVPEETVTKYKGYGIDFNETNAEVGAKLPVPAVYIVDQKGLIRYAYFNKDYKQRPSVTTLLENLAEK
jgi:peroxiredoxin